MRKILFIFIACVLSSHISGQVKISQLTEATTISTSDLFLLTKGDASRKLTFQNLSKSLFNTIPYPLRVNYSGDSIRIGFSGDNAIYSTSQDAHVFNKVIKLGNDSLWTAIETRNYLLTHSADSSKLKSIYQAHLDTSKLHNQIYALTAFPYVKTLTQNLTWTTDDNVIITPSQSIAGFTDVANTWGTFVYNNGTGVNVYIQGRRIGTNKTTSIVSTPDYLELGTTGGVTTGAKLRLDTFSLRYSTYDSTKFVDNSVISYRMLKNAVAGAGSGTLTSVGLTAPTGFSVSGSPITSTGTLALSFAPGYSLPLNTTQDNWNTAYTNRITSLTTTGSSGAATLIGNVLNIPQYNSGIWGNITGTLSNQTDLQTALDNKLTRTTTTDATPDSVWTVVNGQAQRASVTTIPYGYYTNINAAGTVYTLTATSALLDFGTTDPSITVSQAGTWKIIAHVYVHYAGATFAANQTLALKLRRTNNTAADVPMSSPPNIGLDIVSTFTGGDFDITLPPIWYSTANTNDIIQLWGNLSALPSAGSMTITGAWITAEKIYD